MLLSIRITSGSVAARVALSVGKWHELLYQTGLPIAIREFQKFKMLIALFYKFAKKVNLFRVVCARSFRLI